MRDTGDSASLRSQQGAEQETASDLELVRLCAEAMGLNGESGYALIGHMPNHPYDPLHDDAQAMALVKKFNIGIDRGALGNDHWGAALIRGGITMYCATSPSSLNRAICECAAKMQEAKQ